MVGIQAKVYFLPSGFMQKVCSIHLYVVRPIHPVTLKRENFTGKSNTTPGALYSKEIEALHFKKLQVFHSGLSRITSPIFVAE